MNAFLVYPNQLYRDVLTERCYKRVYLVEDPLFFTQYAFHRSKLVLHRATMKSYEARLRSSGMDVRYVEYHELKSTSEIGRLLQKEGMQSVSVFDPNDDWLERRLRAGCQQVSLKLKILPDPHFLTTRTMIEEFCMGKDSLYFTDFYISQRKRLRILVDKNDKPVGGKWSFDAANRKKLPAKQAVPNLPRIEKATLVIDAEDYVTQHFPNAPGKEARFLYPYDEPSSKAWLSTFFAERLPKFGDYEDAISGQHRFLFHAVITPVLNVGIISPSDVLDELSRVGEAIELNSLEGFVRQIIGWREYMRSVYLQYGRRQRTTNFWGFDKPLPNQFYDGSTGILPIDNTIKSLLSTGYTHHIERLMILGNFMLLCRIRPDDVYRWFMEMYIDAYDWVMVPNVYAMSQYADGGKITTKPYISGSAYVRKMSDYPKGDWCDVWDALYWTFIEDHREIFAANHRMSMMVGMLGRLGDKMKRHREVAKLYLASLQ